MDFGNKNFLSLVSEMKILAFGFSFLVQILMAMIAIYKRSDAVKDYGIVGGKDMLTKYVVSLQIAPDGDFDKEFGFYHVCAGAIISAKLILTAATCTGSMVPMIAIKKRKVEDLLVIIGTPIRLQRSPTTQVRKIKEIKMQPNFEFSHSQEIADYDIALLVVFQAIEIDRAFADIIPLTKWPPQRDMLCTVIGWWRVYTGGPVTDEISRTNVYIDSIKDCNQLYAVQLEQSVCITAEKLKEFGTCTGDPGGPLICEGKLYGLLSTRWDRCFGFATYASVYHHLKWLNLTNENLLRYAWAQAEHSPLQIFIINVEQQHMREASIA
ncbi:hypothetical protein GQX74_008751 [Glossina fuscipes]|nr:hypothetical protein GQX74_008751 [Glossina fuscipes]